MQLHGVLQHVELVPPGLRNKNVVGVLPQYFIRAETKERFKLAVDVQNLGAARDHDGFGRGVQQLFQKIGGRPFRSAKSLCRSRLCIALRAQRNNQQLRFRFHPQHAEAAPHRHRGVKRSTHLADEVRGVSQRTGTKHISRPTLRPCRLCISKPGVLPAEQIFHRHHCAFRQVKNVARHPIGVHNRASALHKHVAGQCF